MLIFMLIVTYYYVGTDNVNLIFDLIDGHLQGQTSGDYLHDHSRRFAHRGCPWWRIPHISQK